MATFELSLLRQRSLEAIRQKARRGELQFLLPVGFRRTESGQMEMDPDRRIQESIHLTRGSRKPCELVNCASGTALRRVRIRFARSLTCAAILN